MTRIISHVHVRAHSEFESSAYALAVELEFEFEPKECRRYKPTALRAESLAGQPPIESNRMLQATAESDGCGAGCGCGRDMAADWLTD